MNDRACWVFSAICRDLLTRFAINFDGPDPAASGIRISYLGLVFLSALLKVPLVMVFSSPLGTGLRKGNFRSFGYLPDVALRFDFDKRLCCFAFSSYIA